jgi:hypothetical protein
MPEYSRRAIENFFGHLFLASGVNTACYVSQDFAESCLFAGFRSFFSSF